MSPVEFEESASYQTNIYAMPQTKKRPLLIRWGIVKSEKQLTILYLILIIVLLSSSVFIIYSVNKSRALPYEKIPESAKAKLPADARRILEQQHANLKR